MKFSTREDIEAPLDHVFAKVSNFDSFERSMLRRGVKISRSRSEVVQGTTWRAEFRFRGKQRELDLTLGAIDPDAGYQIDFTSSGLAGQSKVELVPLSPIRTRLMVETTLSPKTLAARLLVQSLKLAKANLTKRYKNRIANLAEEIELSYKP